MKGGRQSSERAYIRMTIDRATERKEKWGDRK